MEQSISYIHGSVRRYLPAFKTSLSGNHPSTPSVAFRYPSSTPKSRFLVPFASRYHPGTPTIAFWYYPGTPAIAFRYHSGTIALVSDTFLIQTSFFGTIISSPRIAFRHLFVQTSVNIYGAAYSFFFLFFFFSFLFWSCFIPVFV